MITTEELNNLIENARSKGAKILIQSTIENGRMITQSITIKAEGINTCNMSVDTAAETLRKWNNNHV